MSRRGKATPKLLKTVLPIVLIFVLVAFAVCVWIVYTVTRPPRAPYLITPKSFSIVTGPILNATDAGWKNHDGTDARGWVIRGAEGSPAVILLHGYGADRSWLLNLAVKLNETTNFTVLWPDLRGHGENPPVNWTLLGGTDGDDVGAAIDYLHTLNTPAGKPLVARRVGVYGIELGAYAALDAARRYPEIRALALDSVPNSPYDLIDAAMSKRLGMSNGLLQRLGGLGMRVYGSGKFQTTPSCDEARQLREVRTLLLAGTESDSWRQSTTNVAKCFNSSVEVRRDLPLTGANLPSATGEQEEGYDRPVIEFFDQALR